MCPRMYKNTSSNNFSFVVSYLYLYINIISYSGDYQSKVAQMSAYIIGFVLLHIMFYRLYTLSCQSIPFYLSSLVFIFCLNQNLYYLCFTCYKHVSLIKLYYQVCGTCFLSAICAWHCLAYKIPKMGMKENIAFIFFKTKVYLQNL